MNEIQTKEIEKIEMEIDFYKGQAVQSIFEIGERLIKAKELVPYGEWGGWLKEKVKFSQAQANNYMKVSREFADSQSIRKLGQTKIFAMLALPEEKRETFIEENPVEDMTTRELRQAIKEKKELEEEVNQYKYQQEILRDENKNLKKRKPEIVEKEIEKIPDDYNYYKETTEKLQDTVLKLNNNLMDSKTELSSLEREKNILERKAKLNEDESKKYHQLKNQIENLSKQKDDLGRQIKSRTELSGLVVRIENMLKTELAPIKYSRAINEAKTDEIVIRNLREIVARVQEWCDEMNKYIGDEKYINVEVIENE